MPTAWGGNHRFVVTVTVSIDGMAWYNWPTDYTVLHLEIIGPSQTAIMTFTLTPEPDIKEPEEDEIHTDIKEEEEPDDPNDETLDDKDDTPNPDDPDYDEPTVDDTQPDDIDHDDINYDIDDDYNVTDYNDAYETSPNYTPDDDHPIEDLYDFGAGGYLEPI